MVVSPDVEYKMNINGIHQKEDLDKVNKLSLEIKFLALLVSLLQGYCSKYK